MSQPRRCAGVRSCWSAASDRRKLSGLRTFEICHVIQREGPQRLSGHIQRTVDVPSQAAHSLAGGHQGGSSVLGPAQAIGVPLDGHARLRSASCGSLGEWSGRAARGASRDGFIGVSARSGRPSAGAASRGNLSRIWCHSPCPAALPTVVLCRINKMFRIPVRDRAQQQLECVRGHGRYCARPMVHKRPNAPNYALNLPRVHRPDSIGRRQITITPEKTE